jgi:lipopolysaccharide transport system permease protein
MNTQTKTPVIHVRPERGAGVLSPLEVWRFRALLWQMTVRNIQSRVVSSPLSLVWGFIRPGIMTLAFVYLRQISGADFGTEVPYALYIFSGFCLWFLFQDTAIQVAGSLAADAGLSQKIYFPKILSPLAIVLSRWVDVLIIAVAIVALQLAMGVPVGPDMVYLVPAMGTLLLLAFALGVLFAGLMIYHPDNRKFLETLLYLGLFLSPVLFSKKILPQIVQDFYLFNPMVGILSSIRGSMFAPETIDFLAWQVAVAFSVVLSFLGLFVLASAARNNSEKI